MKSNVNQCEEEFMRTTLMEFNMLEWGFLSFAELPSHNILHLNRTLKMRLDVKRWSRVHHTVESLMHLLRNMPSQFKKLQFLGLFFLQCLKQKRANFKTVGIHFWFSRILHWNGEVQRFYISSPSAKTGKIVDPQTLHNNLVSVLSILNTSPRLKCMTI